MPAPRPPIRRYAAPAAVALGAVAAVALARAAGVGVGPAVPVPVVLPAVLAVAVGLMIRAAGKARRAAAAAAERDEAARQEELKLIESVVAHAATGTAVLDAGPSGPVVRFANDAFCRLVGRKAEELAGRPLPFPAVSALTAAGEPVEADVRLDRPDGTAFWAGVSLVPVVGGPGSSGHWVLALADVTARRAAEDAHHDTARLLRSIIDAFPGLISAKDAASRYLLMNDYQAKLYGTTPGAALGRTAGDLISPEYGAYTAARDREVIDTGKTLQYEETTPDSTGRRRDWLTLKAPLREAGGAARGVVNVSLDIAPLKDAQAALRESEERLRAIGDNLPDGAVYQVVVPPGGPPRFAHMSAGIEALLGVTAAEVRADPETLYRLIDPADLPGFRKAELDSFLALRPFEFEFRSAARGGGRRWLHLRSRPTPTPDGGSVWNGAVTDVTERREAEDALRRSEALFRGIFEGAAAGVSLTDRTGRFTAANPAFLALTGRTLDELKALTPADISHPDDWAVQAPFTAELVAGARDRIEMTKRYVRPDGGVVWTELSLSAVRGADGAYEYGLGVSIDVTARRRLEEQFQQSQQADAVAHLAGGVAHDFNNLLTVITGNLALARPPEDHPTRPLVAAAEQAAARAADLTRKLLGYARRNQMAAGPVAPGEVLHAVAAALARGADPRVRFRVAVAPGCGPVLADAGLLHQALLNLGTNARDAMPHGGVLTLSAAPAGDGVVRLGVADTGTGMTDEVKARIFEPFFTTKEVGKGTGLGLAMVRGIVEQHRGRVAVTTAPGAGSRFDLDLPAATAAAAAPARPSPPEVAYPDAREAAAPTILLVDDEAMIRELGRTVLERAGYRVLTADDGVTGVEAFAAHRADIGLVVMDVTMPRMSGRDAFRHILDLAPDARVLFSTGYSAEDVASLDGSVGLLSKPYRPNELVAAVRAALAGEPVPSA